MIMAPRLRVWRPHDGLSFKLNTNATIDSKGERIGLAAVIRGTNGNLCAAASVVAYRGLDVEVAEAKAIREASSRCDVINVVRDIIDLKSRFDVRSFSFVHRSNRVAHVVANRAFCLSSSVLWFASFLDWLLSLILDGFAVVISSIG
ncbi:hypothetical protein ACOSP7_014482 [Xanthoceras sorbifolium]